MIHGASNPQPHLAGLAGGQGIRGRCLGRGDGVLVRGKAGPVAPPITDRGEADSLAQPLRPPEDRLRLTTLLSLLVEPAAADLHEFVGARSIPHEACDDRPDERPRGAAGGPPPLRMLSPSGGCCRHRGALIRSSGLRLRCVGDHTSIVANTAPEGEGSLATTWCREVHDSAEETPGSREELPYGLGKKYPSSYRGTCPKLPNRAVSAMGLGE